MLGMGIFLVLLSLPIWASAASDPIGLCKASKTSKVSVPCSPPIWVVATIVTGLGILFLAVFVVLKRRSARPRVAVEP
jgi:hypothetical protein